MADLPPITRILIETIGAHEHVSVWFGGKLSGTIVVDAGQGDDLKGLLEMGATMKAQAQQIAPMVAESKGDTDVAVQIQLAMNSLVAGMLGLPTMEDVMAMARVSRDSSWLVKDFNVLYRVADETTAAMAVEGYVAHDLATQLARLKPAYELTESVREATRTGLAAPHKSWAERGLDLLGKLSGRRTELRPATDADWRGFASERLDADDPRREALDKVLAGVERTKQSGEGD
jgi:hypothetical protein